MALTMAIYGTYGWQPGNWASSFYNYYYYIIIYKFNYILSCLRVRVYEKGLPGCQVATSERQVVFRVVVEDDAFLIGLHILRRALNDEIATDVVIMFIMLCFLSLYYPQNLYGTQTEYICGSPLSVGDLFGGKDIKTTETAALT